MTRRLGPCMCAATDCSSCGPAQGYGPENEAEAESQAEAEYVAADDDATRRAEDRWQADRDRTASQ